MSEKYRKIKVNAIMLQSVTLRDQTMHSTLIVVFAIKHIRLESFSLQRYSSVQCCLPACQISNQSSEKTPVILYSISWFQRKLSHSLKVCATIFWRICTRARRLVSYYLQLLSVLQALAEALLCADWTQNISLDNANLSKVNRHCGLINRKSILKRQI